MKRTAIVFLAWGILCPQLLPQGLPFVFHVSDPAIQMEVEPAVIAPRSRVILSLWDPPSDVSDPSKWFGVRSREDSSPAENKLRTALISYPSPPEVNSPEVRRMRKQRLVSGLLLATSWAGTVVVDLFVWDYYRSTTVIPLAGPWITLARMASNDDPGWPGAKALLVASGVAQAASATWFIISLTRHPEPRETKAVSISAGFNMVSLRIQF